MRNLSLTLLSIFFSLALSACASPDHDAVILCTKTIESYADLRDNPEAANAYAELFTENGEFKLGDTNSVGRDALIARHQASHQSAIWRHEIGNRQVHNNRRTGEIIGTSQVTVLTGAKDVGEYQRKIVATYDDIFVMQNGSCLIKSRKVNVRSDETVDD